MGVSRSRLVVLMLAPGFLLAAGGLRGAELRPCSVLAAAGIELSSGPAGVLVERADRSAVRAGIRAGDRVKQINGLAVSSCPDAERAVSSARRRLVAVLLLLERNGERVAAVVKPTPPRSWEGKNAGTARARPEVKLPELTAQDGTADSLVGLALKAAEEISRVERAARIQGVLAVYSRRLSQAQAAIAQLDFGDSGPGKDLARAVAEIVDYYRTAEKMWRFKAEKSRHLRYDRRMVGKPLPYFSDSEVERWIGRYPFLESTIIREPREVTFVMPGEGSGLWDCDRAIELIWSKAGEKRRKLEHWATGKTTPR